MAACGSLQHMLDNSLPESPTLLESLSQWKQIKKSMNNPIDDSISEIFGELHFKETPRRADPDHDQPAPFSSSTLFTEYFPSRNAVDDEKNYNTSPTAAAAAATSNNFPNSNRRYRHSDSFSSMNSESLSLCTEGLGFESSDDVEDDLLMEEWTSQDERAASEIPSPIGGELRRTRSSCCSGGSVGFGGEFSGFPPPISCIGRSGKPWVCFKSYRRNGRFILKEVKIRTQEFLHAHREDGRLKLHFVQSDDEFLQEEEEEDEDEDEEEKDQREQEEEEEEETGEKKGEEEEEYLENGADVEERENGGNS